MKNQACLIAIGGYTGSGKTTLAYELKASMPALVGALVIDGDQVRRALLGYDLRYVMQENDYSYETTERVILRCGDLARKALLQGRSVIDASGFWSEEERLRIQALATDCTATFKAVWLTAPQAVLLSRIEKRLYERENEGVLSVECGHASDACGVVLTEKCAAFPEPDDPLWPRIDASKDPKTTLYSVIKVLGYT